MKAKITSKCKHTDVDSRIGAFEVQVAFKDSEGVIFTELLHSKLLSRHWPNKSAMEKKLKLFVLSSGIAVHPLYDPNQCSDGYKSEGLGTYPVGFVEWEDTPLADTTWTFPVIEKEKITVVETMNPLDMLKNGSKEVEKTVVPTPLARQRSSSFIDLNANLSNNEDNDKSLNVQWVFDARTVIGIVQKPIVTYTPAPNRVTATQISAPIPPKQRPASASAVRPTSTSTATSTLVKLNVRQLSAKNSQKSLISLESEKDNNERNENNQANQNNQSNKSNQSNKEVASSSSSQSRNIIDQLKKIASDMIGKGRENQPLFSFNPILLVKKGFLSAETTALSVFLRKVVIAYCRTMNTNGNKNNNGNVNTNGNNNGNTNGNMISADSISAGILTVFKGLDIRGVGSLNVDDITSLLTQLLGRNCSDIAISLLLLSIGKHFYEFSLLSATFQSNWYI